MAPAIAPDVVAQILELRAAGLNKAAIARKLKITRDTVIRYCADAEVEPIQQAPADPVELEQRRVARQKRERECVDAVKELAFRQYLERLVTEHVEPLPAPRATQRSQSSSARHAHKRFPLLALTDWHFEEKVNPAGVLGLNSYDIPTASKRVHRVVHAAIDWKRDFEAAKRFQVPKLTVALMGDFLTGTLHGLERHSDAANIVRAVLRCGDLLALALADLAAVFPQVEVIGVVGNHGRLPDDRKVPTKDPTRSWDYLAYEIARRRLHNARNISWFLPEAYGALFEVAGHCCYVAHGNFIPNNLGVVGYGVRRFTSALASNLSAAGKQLRYCFFGHWHQANSAEFAGMQAFICPSLIGTQEYSFLAGGAVNRPAQQMFVFDNELGLVGQETLYGESTGHQGTYEVESR